MLIVVCIGANSFFVLIETALTESHKNRLEKLADDGDSRAARVLTFYDEPEDIMSFVQIGITFAGILVGTAIGARIAPEIEAIIHSPHAYWIALVSSIIIVTYINLLFGEFLPKIIALQKPEEVLMQHFGKLIAIQTISKPFVLFLSKSASVILLILGLNPHVDDTVTEDEVKDLIEQGTEDGTFEKTEQDMVDRIFHMSDQTAYSLMTPRTQMHWLDLEDSLAYNLQLIKKNPATVFPVGKNNLDDFRGIVYAKDLLNAAISKKSLDIEQYIKKPLLITRSMEMFRVLERFQESGVHEAVVLDEYGGVIGFITLQDIVEELIGETEAEGKKEDSPITAAGSNIWYLDGLCTVDDFKEEFDIDDELPNEVKDHYQTMGGFVTSYLGYIPHVNETLTWDEFTFKIVKMDRARIDKMMITRTPKEKKPEGDEE
ncbi:MAG: hemolysin family protein [Selenomonadaceae bacterium]